MPAIRMEAPADFSAVRRVHDVAFGRPMETGVLAIPGPGWKTSPTSENGKKLFGFGGNPRASGPNPRRERISMFPRLAMVFLLLAAASLPAGDAAAKMYIWKDKNGVTHFTDTPPPDEVAKESVSTLPTVTYTPPPETPAPESRPALRPERTQRPAPAPRRASRRTRAPKVEMYSTSWCGYCKKAKAFFRSQGVSVTEYDVEKDKGAARRMRELGNAKSVPFVVIGDQRIRGYNEAAYLRALGE